jgi:beta-lactamase regulating signal transducer with metallopeptidase domain
MNSPVLQSLASVALDRILFSLVGGTALAVLVAFLVRLLPRKDSQTGFLVWFSTLLATAVLPLVLVVQWPHSTVISHYARQEALALPSWLVEYSLLAWLIFATAGLLRIAAGLWQLRKMRAECEPLDPGTLAPELAEELAGNRKLRQLEVLVSDHATVATAVGFFKPAIILPKWLLEEGSPEDLKHVLLHELAHLRRWDDWTNLLQRVLKALLFFHPAIWWMERKIALHREMACDDAVLAVAASPRVYAESLARMAERSFLRRQLALAQAAVGRVHQLTVRVTRILDPDRPAASRYWKPAIPGVLALALLCGVGFSWVPEMVTVEDAHAQAAPEAMNFLSKASHAQPGLATLAAQKGTPSQLYHAALYQQPEKKAESPSPVAQNVRRESRSDRNYHAANYRSPRRTQKNNYVLLIATQRTVTATPTGYQVTVTQTRWLVPQSAVKQNPRRS